MGVCPRRGKAGRTGRGEKGTGRVKCAGTAGESILGYLTRAGGVDPERGSYIDVRLARSGEPRAQFDLYDFLLTGTLQPVQLQDGDTIVVGARQNAVQVSGEVFNADCKTSRALAGWPAWIQTSASDTR